MGRGWMERFELLGITPQDLAGNFREVTHDTPAKRELSAQEHYFYGQYYAAMDEYAHAIGEMKAALEENPGNINIMLGIANAYIDSKQYEEADKMIDQILQADPKRVEAMLMRAASMIAQSDTQTSRRKELLDSAITCLEQAKRIQPRNLDVLRALAKAYFEQQNIEKILQAHRDILAVDPKDVYSLLVMGNLLARINRQQEAIQYYDRVIEQRPGFINTYLYLAQLYEEMGRTQDAIDTYKRALLIQPRNEQLLKKFNQLLTKSVHNGASGDVLKSWQQFATEYPYSSEIQRLYADQLRSTKDAAGAIKQYQKVLELDPENVDALVSLGVLSVGQKNSDKAIEYFSKAIDISPERMETYDAIASSMLSQDAKEQAKILQIYQRAIKVNPSAMKLYVTLAGLYQQMGKPQDAIDTINLGISRAGDKPELLVLLGQLSEKKGDYAKAIDAFEKAYGKAGAQNRGIFIKLLSLLIHEKKTERANQIITEALNEAPEKSELLALIGETYYDAFDIPNATKYYEQAVAANGSSMPVVGRLVLLYNTDKQYDKSIKLIERLREAQRDRTELDRLLADTYMNQKAYDKAIELYTSLVQKYPDDVDNYRLLADALTKAKKYEDATATVRKAETKLGKTNEEVMALRGITLYQQKRYDQSEKVFKELLQLKSRSADTYYYFLGSISLEQKRFDAAERYFRKALEVNPTNDSVLNALGYMFADQNTKLPEAKQLVEKALELNPNAPHILDSLGWVYFRMGKYNEALDYVTRAEKLIGEDPEVFEHLGDINKAMGNSERAQEYWKKSAALDETRTSVREKAKTGDRR